MKRCEDLAMMLLLLANGLHGLKFPSVGGVLLALVSGFVAGCFFGLFWLGRKRSTKGE